MVRDDVESAAAMNTFITEAWILFGVAFAITALRTYARARINGIKALQLDDALVWVGQGCFAVEVSLATYVNLTTHGLAIANNGMDDAYRAALDPNGEEYKLRVAGSIIQVIGWSGYTALLWTLKASLLCFYLRLTNGLDRAYRIRIWVGFGLLGTTFLASILNIFLSCRPLNRYWQINPDPGNVCQPAVAHQIVWTCLAFNVLTDLYLLAIPLPMLWNSTLKPLKKLGLMIVFSGGLLVIMCAIIRVHFILSDPINGAQLAGAWAIRETFVAITTTNLPGVFPLLKLWLVPILGSLLTSMLTTMRLKSNPSGGGTKKNSRGGGGSALNTIGGSGKPSSWRGRGPPSVNPITNVSVNGSEERIIGNREQEEFKMKDLGRKSESSSERRLGGVVISKEVQVEVTTEARGTRGVGEDGMGKKGDFSAFAVGPRRGF